MYTLTVGISSTSIYLTTRSDVARRYLVLCWRCIQFVVETSWVMLIVSRLILLSIHYLYRDHSTALPKIIIATREPAFHCQCINLLWDVLNRSDSAIMCLDISWSALVVLSRGILKLVDSGIICLKISYWLGTVESCKI